MTFPTNVASTREGSVPADASAALDETTASSVALPSSTRKSTNRQHKKRSGENGANQLDTIVVFAAGFSVQGFQSATYAQQTKLPGRQYAGYPFKLPKHLARGT